MKGILNKNGLGKMKILPTSKSFAMAPILLPLALLIIVVISMEASNVPPVVAINAGIVVDEGGTEAITGSVLLVTDVDNTSSEIVFTLITAPTHGTLYLSGTPLSSGSLFTQMNIDNGLLSYTHDGNGATSDNFVFDVTDGTNTTSYHTFNITINPVDDPPVVAINAGIVVDEGGTEAITGSVLLVTDVDNTSSEIVFNLITAPAQGTLYLSGTPLSSGSLFTQMNIDNGLLSYTHDGNGATSDNFVFNVTDTTSYHPFNITINPVDDPPIANAGPDQLVYQEATLDGSLSSDEEDNIDSYQWHADMDGDDFFETYVGDGVTVYLSTSIVESLGLLDRATTIQLTVTDFTNLSGTDTMILIVARGGEVLEDILPPSGAVHAYPNILWPPDNKMITVTIEGYVRDEYSMAREGGGIGVASAYLMVNETKIILRDETIDLLSSGGSFSINVELKAEKGARYDIELHATDKKPIDQGGPNQGIVDSTYVEVPHNR